MSTVTAQEIPIQVQVKVRESLWKRAKHVAIQRGCSLQEVVEEALAALPEFEVRKKRESQ